MKLLFFKTNFQKLFILCSLFILLTSYTEKSEFATKEKWGEVQNKPVYLYTLKNKAGMTVKLTNYGGIITSILVPDKHGKFEDVVLGFDNLKQYTGPNPCFGATIGRYANRIKNGRFTIDDTEYQLTQNDHQQCSHGGMEFNRAVWKSKLVKNEHGEGVQFYYFSKDGSNGFPGNLKTNVTYTLSKDNKIYIEYKAETDKDTYVNFTNHSYFNLTGSKEKIYNHKIQIKANNYTEIDEDIVPTGKISSVKNTLWDLTKLTRIGDHIHELKFNGYHYNYIFNKPLNQLKDVITVIEPNSGRTLTVATTQPAVQFYTGNAIPNFIGKNNTPYSQHSAFCLETQHYPDSPNHSNFPSTLLKPGEKFNQTTIFKFGIKQ